MLSCEWRTRNGRRNNDFGCLVVGPALLVMDIIIGAKSGKGVGE